MVFSWGMVSGFSEMKKLGNAAGTLRSRGTVAGERENWPEAAALFQVCIAAPAVNQP
jgi:hypothetical protein